MATYDENNRSKMKLQVSIVIVVLCLNCCLTSGFMDIEELKNVYYGLDILTDPVVLNKEETPLGTVQVTSRYGQPYQCTFPDLTLEDRRKEEEEKLAVETGIAEMLRPMATQDCLFKTKDWWSYEFCYGKYIRQFHMEEGVIKGNIIYLGNYEDDFDWANDTAREDRLRSKATISRYHSQTYTEGTKCDLTGQPRRAEVRFLCEENSSDYLSRVDESATCMYTVTIMTSRICRHPDLKAPARRRPVPITCNPLLTEGEFHDYMEEIEEQKLQREKDSILKSAAALKYGDPNTKFSMSDLDRTLEEAMSSIAKDLLAKPVEQIIPKQQPPQPSQPPMTREQFEGKFGKEGGLYDLYLRGIEIAQKRQAKVLQRIAAKHAKKEGEGTAEETDEDDELMKEFDEEIKQIKATFEKSSSKVTALQNKLRMQKSWEDEIENVIKEAENELGVKVDRSMVSGLSNTLDKLVNKLQDTHEQLTSMDTELHRLNEKAAAKDNEAKDTEATDAADDSWTNILKDDTDDEDEDEEMDENAKMEKDLDLHFKEDAEQLELEVAAAETEANDLMSGLDSKILPPPKTEFGSGMQQEGGGEEPGSFMDEAGVTEEGAGVVPEAAGGAAPEAPKMSFTITKKKDENEVPERVQKMLEEKMRKEMEKKTEGDDTRIDTDHSFHHKDKSVHIFQEEDEDGKTNKFIMVVGLNSFNDDENTESVKQSQLEDSYGFKYTRKQKKLAPAS